MPREQSKLRPSKKRPPSKVSPPEERTEDVGDVVMHLHFPHEVKQNEALKSSLSKAIDGIAKVLMLSAVNVIRDSESGELRLRPSPDPLLLGSLVDRAKEVIGDEAEAFRWLGTPVKALDYLTPISLLGTPEGAQRVTDVLMQMERGVW